jgi:hypothetical protein
MEKQQIIGLAQQGDLEAIATLLNQSLARYDTIAKVGQNKECLFVTLISDPVPDEELVIPIVLQEIERWKTDNIKKIKIYGRTERQITPAWEDEISLELIPQTVTTQISQEPPTILNKPSLETNHPEDTEVYNSETTNAEIPTSPKPSFSLRNLPMWGKGAIVALFASGSAGSLAILSNQLNTKTPTPTTTAVPLVTPSASPTPTTTPTTKSTPTTPQATTTPTPTTTPKATDNNTSERKQTTTTPTNTNRRRRTTTTNQQTQTQPTQRKRTNSATNNTQSGTRKTGTTNNTRSTQRTSVPKKTTPKRTTPQVKPTSTPQSTGQPIYVPPPEKKTNVEIVPKSVNTPTNNNTGTTRRRNTDITPPSAPANRRNTDVTPPSAPASKKDVTPTGGNGGDTP